MKRVIQLFKFVLMCLVLLVNQAAANAQNKSAYIHLPAGYEKEALAALSYFPELRNAHVSLVIRHAYTPLSTRPSFFSIFRRPSKRNYIITISDKTIAALRPILFHNLSDSARIGVLGHELSHVADYQEKNTWGFLRLALKHSSKQYQDKIEYKTDGICLGHGMGVYLLCWSKFVRLALHRKNWRGADNIKQADLGIERYMNPDTIEKYLSNSSS